MKQDVIIIGGGASGFFCAINLAAICPSAKITILEKSNKLLSKVKISGGGRCNVTNAQDSLSAMAKNYPRGEKLVKKTFKDFFTTDTKAWFLERGIRLVAEADGRMFPESNSSQTIIDCFLSEASKYAIDIKMQCAVENIQSVNDVFTVTYNKLHSMQAKYVVVASGGYPKLEHFAFLQHTRHIINSPVPSLFTFNIPKHDIHNLMGLVAPNATIKIVGSKLEQSGPVLITHWGLSGPCVLSLSAYAARYLQELDYKYTLQINWISNFNETTLLEYIRSLRNTIGSQVVIQKNFTDLPSRLWQFLVQASAIENNTTWANCTAKQQNLLVKNLCSYVLQANGKTTYKEEFVTAGGVSLSEVDLQTCESKLLPNLYFAGEILDVDGRTGGFNFQHAWSSAMAVARDIASSIV